MKDPNPHENRFWYCANCGTRNKSNGLGCYRCQDADENTPGSESEVMPCFPPKVARAHAAELRQVLADLLEWRARRNAGEPQHEEWKAAKALMEQIRDEEDEAQEER